MTAQEFVKELNKAVAIIELAISSGNFENHIFPSIKVSGYGYQDDVVTYHVKEFLDSVKKSNKQCSSIGGANLYSMYKKWCCSNSYELDCCTATLFGILVRTLGVPKKRTKAGFFYLV